MLANANNNGAPIVTPEDLKGLSEEGIKRLVRRGRDVYNKNINVRIHMLTEMINGGLIHKNDLC